MARAKLIGRADVARLCGGNAPEVTEGSPPPKVLIDPAHPDAERWVAKHRGKPEEDRRGELAAPRNIRDLLGLTLQQVTDRHGSSAVFLDWLQARKLIATVDSLEQRRLRERGELISRALVDRHVFGAYDALHRQLLHEAAATIAARCYELCRAGSPVEEAEQAACGIVSDHLKGVDRKIRAGLRGAAVPSGKVPRCESVPAAPKHPASFPTAELAQHVEDSVRAAVPSASREQVRAMADEVAADTAQSYGAVIAAAVANVKSTTAPPEEDRSHAET